VPARRPGAELPGLQHLPDRPDGDGEQVARHVVGEPGQAEAEALQDQRDEQQRSPAAPGDDAEQQRLQHDDQHAVQADRQTVGPCAEPGRQ
jgi:hypothetical protein